MKCLMTKREKKTCQRARIIAIPNSLFYRGNFNSQLEAGYWLGSTPFEVRRVVSISATRASFAITSCFAIEQRTLYAEPLLRLHLSK